MEILSASNLSYFQPLDSKLPVPLPDYSPEYVVPLEYAEIRLIFILKIFHSGTDNRCKAVCISWEPLLLDDIPSDRHK